MWMTKVTVYSKSLMSLDNFNAPINVYVPLSPNQAVVGQGRDLKYQFSL